MCFSIAKYLLFAFNFAFWLAGAACLGVGIWLNVDENVTESIEVAGVEIFLAGAYVLIAAGAIMLVVGFFGCCGAIKESQCLLGLYFGCLFVVFGLQVGIGIWALVSYDSFQPIIDEALNATDWETATAQNVMAATQQNLKCCGGVSGCKDYFNAMNTDGSSVCGCDPSDFDNSTTCVSASSLGCDPDMSTEPASSNIYEQPCNEAIYNLLEENMTIVGAVALGIGLAEILGMIISMCLCCSIKDK